MTSYLKHNHAYGNNLTGGSSKSFKPWDATDVKDVGNLSEYKIIIVDAKSVLFGSSGKWDERETPSGVHDKELWEKTSDNTPAKILYNICNENKNSMVYVLSNYYNKSHFEKFNDLIIKGDRTQYPLDTNIDRTDGIKNLTIETYFGADKKNKMENILKSEISKKIFDKKLNADIIYVTRNYRGGNSKKSIEQNNRTQKEIIQTIIKNTGNAQNAKVRATTAHIPNDIFYKHYLKSPTQLMYKNGSDMLQSYSSASPADIAYGPFMKSPQAYKRDNQWLWPPSFPSKTTNPKTEDNIGHNKYMDDNPEYAKLYTSGQVNKPY